MPTNVLLLKNKLETKLERRLSITSKLHPSYQKQQQNPNTKNTHTKPITLAPTESTAFIKAQTIYDFWFCPSALSGGSPVSVLL